MGLFDKIKKSKDNVNTNTYAQKWKSALIEDTNNNNDYYAGRSDHLSSKAIDVYHEWHDFDDPLFRLARMIILSIQKTSADNMDFEISTYGTLLESYNTFKALDDPDLWRWYIFCLLKSLHEQGYDDSLISKFNKVNENEALYSILQIKV